MKKVTFGLIFLIASFWSAGNEIQFIVKYSEELAVFTFLEYLDEEGRDNPHRKLFQESKYNTPEYQRLIRQVNSIGDSYSFNYSQYKHKNEFYGESFIKNKLVTEKSRDEMKLSLTGLLSNEELSILFSTLEIFTPIYNELIFNPNKEEFNRHINNLKRQIEEKDVNSYFEKAKSFYSSTWNSDLPVYLVFYPLVNSKSFTATAYNNISESALPLSTDDYVQIITVVLHELVHLLYEEQPVKIQNELDSLFKINNSKYTRFAYDILNESWATAVANGYFYLKLKGSVSSARWYNWKYIDSMAKRAFPLFNNYLSSQKSVDKEFVDSYIKLFEDSCKDWLQELPFLMTNRNIMTSNKTHIDTINKIFRYRSISNSFLDYSVESFEKLKNGSIKFIIVSENHKTVYEKIRNNFKECESWKFDYAKDFVEMKILNDKSALIIINLVNKELGAMLRVPKVNLIE